MIKTLFSDLGNVLIPFNWDRAIEAITKSLNLASTTYVQTLMRIGDHRQTFRQFEKGEIPTEEYLFRLNNLLQTNISLDEYRSILNSVFVVDRRLVDYYQELRVRYPNLKFIAISNVDECSLEVVLKMLWSIGFNFDDVVASCEVRCLKPEKEIFQTALQLAGCRPDECFFVDDIEGHCNGARSLGIPSFEYRCFHEFKNFLEPLLQSSPATPSLGTQTENSSKEKLLFPYCR